MSLAFIIVLLVVGWMGFPMILRSISQRKEYIDSSLDAAREAERQLEGIQAEHDRIVAQAQDEKVSILREASVQRDRMISEAKEQAETLSRQIVEQARERATAEREEILLAARHQVALLSVAVAEKVLRERLENPDSQVQLCERLIDEIDKK